MAVKLKGLRPEPEKVPPKMLHFFVKTPQKPMLVNMWRHVLNDFSLEFLPLTLRREAKK